MSKLKIVILIMIGVTLMGFKMPWDPKINGTWQCNISQGLSNANITNHYFDNGTFQAQGELNIVDASGVATEISLILQGSWWEKGDNLIETITDGKINSVKVLGISISPDKLPAQLKNELFSSTSNSIILELSERKLILQEDDGQVSCVR